MHCENACCSASALLCCLAIAQGLTLGRLGQLTEMNPEEKQNTYNRLLCAVPGVPDRWEARSILLLLDYSPALPTTHSTPYLIPYPTILLYYIVNTLTMYLSLYCMCVVLFVCWSLARWLALPCPLCRACPCPLLVGCLLIF